MAESHIVRDRWYSNIASRRRLESTVLQATCPHAGHALGSQRKTSDIPATPIILRKIYCKPHQIDMGMQDRAYLFREEGVPRCPEIFQQ